jgi:hypothetical protein
VGDGIFTVALAWRVYHSYSSPAALSVVGIAFFVPRLLVTIAGGVRSELARWPRSRCGLGGAAAVLLTLAVPGVSRPKYLSEEPS